MSQLLMATVVPPGGALEGLEAEPVLVESDGEFVTLTLDDGSQYVLDRQDLQLALADCGERAA